jgi:hypothetical protein
VTNIYINGDNNVVNVVTGGQPVRVAATRRNPRVGHTQPVEDQLKIDWWQSAGFVIALVVFLIFIVNELYLLMLILSVVCLLVSYGMEWREKHLAAIQARRRNVAALMARADGENAAYLQGDSRGMYGDYQPEKL